MSGVYSSAQQRLPASPADSSPSRRPGCHTPKAAPSGRRGPPTGPAPTVTGGAGTLPLALRTASAVASASEHRKYTVQPAGSWPPAGGAQPATIRPARSRKP